jgi:hypothetical protein
MIKNILDAATMCLLVFMTSGLVSVNSMASANTNINNGFTLEQGDLAVENGDIKTTGDLNADGNATIAGKLTHGCPEGMVNAGGYCIHSETPYPLGLNWWSSLDQCIADGYRICSQTEVVNALRAGKLRQYAWAERNAWYTTGSQAENSPGSGTENQICDVQGNTNEQGHPQYAVQCSHGKSESSWKHTVCCY